MRVRESVREGFRDLSSGAARAGVFALVLLVLVGAVVALRASSLVEDVRAAHHWIASGAATRIVTADDRIDGAACDALADAPDVLAAGALRADADGTTPRTLPRTAIPTYAVSRGFAGVVGADHPGAAGVAVARSVADELGVRSGGELVTTAGRAPVSGVYESPDDGRDADLAYAVLAPATPDGTPFDACWATIWPSGDASEAALRRVVLPSTGADGEDRVTTGVLNPTLGTAFEPSAPPGGARTAAGIAGAVGLVLGVAAVLRRRLSIASDRHVGVPIVAQVVGLAVQHLAWGSVGAAGALAVGVVLTRGLAPPDAVPIVVETTATAAVAALGTVLGGVIGLVLVRERALHRYFRIR